jgi:hypothetical protein
MLVDSIQLSRELILSSILSILPAKNLVASIIGRWKSYGQKPFSELPRMTKET